MTVQGKQDAVQDTKGPFRVLICMGCGHTFANGLAQHLEVCTVSDKHREHAVELMKAAGYR